MLLEHLERLAPFGNGNREPMFAIVGIEVEAWEFFGKEGNHCKLITSGDEDISIISWNGRNLFDELPTPTALDVVGTVGLMRTGGRVH